LLGCAVLLSGGCAPSQPEQFVLSEQTKKLPERHQKQIEEILTRFYGEAGDPRWMIPSPADQASANQASANQASANQGSAAKSESSKKEGEEDVTAGLMLVEKVDPAHLRLGMEVYNLRCAPCHGISGDGAGAAAPFFDPLPRDYRRGTFKFISTPRGAKPRREDLARTITYGAKGTAMPSFRWLPEDQLQAVIDYVMMLSYRGELERKLVYDAETLLEPDEDFYMEDVVDRADEIDQAWEKAPQEVVQPAVPNPPMTDETIHLGAVAFQRQLCTKCHGRNGKGGHQPGITPADLGKDDWGHVAYPADLTSGMLHGGRRPIDVYRRIYAGINGTPMPAFATAYQDDPNTPQDERETIWYLVHFIISVVEGGEFLMPKVPQEKPAGEPKTPADDKTDTQAKPDDDASNSNADNSKTDESQNNNNGNGNNNRNGGKPPGEGDASTEQPTTGLSLNPPDNLSSSSSRK
jgi:mono/diheme cytochrome c family protein